MTISHVDIAINNQGMRSLSQFFISKERISKQTVETGVHYMYVPVLFFVVESLS